MKLKFKKMAETAGCAVYIALAMANPVLASSADVNEVIKPLVNLKILVFAIISAIGAILFGFNLMHFSSALKDRDTSSMQTAGLAMAGGFLMFSIGGVMAFLGVS